MRTPFAPSPCRWLHGAPLGKALVIVVLLTEPCVLSSFRCTNPTEDEPEGFEPETVHEPYPHPHQREHLGAEEPLDALEAAVSLSEDVAKEVALDLVGEFVSHSASKLVGSTLQPIGALHTLWELSDYFAATTDLEKLTEATLGIQDAYLQKIRVCQDTDKSEGTRVQRLVQEQLSKFLHKLFEGGLLLMSNDQAHFTVLNALHSMAVKFGFQDAKEKGFRFPRMGQPYNITGSDPKTWVRKRLLDEVWRLELTADHFFRCFFATAIEADLTHRENIPYKGAEWNDFPSEAFQETSGKLRTILLQRSTQHLCCQLDKALMPWHTEWHCDEGAIPQSGEWPHPCKKIFLDAECSEEGLCVTRVQGGPAVRHLMNFMIQTAGDIPVAWVAPFQHNNESGVLNLTD